MTTSTSKYTHDALQKYCLEKNITLTQDYSQIKITRKTKIEGKCTNGECAENFQKLFSTLLMHENYHCKKCTGKLVHEKSKKTNLEKYGVENVFQSEMHKEKMKKTCLEKYGVA